jgi:hypothetical protein
MRWQSRLLLSRVQMDCTDKRIGYTWYDMVSSLNPNLPSLFLLPPPTSGPPKSQKRHMSQCSKYAESVNIQLHFYWPNGGLSLKHQLTQSTYFHTFSFPFNLYTSPYKSIQNIKPQFSSIYIYIIKKKILYI